MTRTGMIMNYLVANIQNVTLEKMTAHFGHQPKYLSRFIRQLFDQTFSQLKTETRVSISKSLLELTTKSIEEISEIVGVPLQILQIVRTYHLNHSMGLSSLRI
ncbi:helix-turn-helix transcriptional regulator [Lactobacillus delbrueckii]